jgi:hypothetical protein
MCSEICRHREHWEGNPYKRDSFWSLDSSLMYILNCFITILVYFLRATSCAEEVINLLAYSNSEKIRLANLQELDVHKGDIGNSFFACPLHTIVKSKLFREGIFVSLRWTS